MIPGTKYRIIDYDTTAVGSNIQVAYNSFDVIVEATSNSSLSENAYACETKRINTLGQCENVSGFPFTMNNGSHWTSLNTNDIPTDLYTEMCVENNVDSLSNNDIKYGKFTKNLNKSILKARFNWVSGSGNHQINCIGVDVVQNDVVVSHDYHRGFSGYNISNNEYTLEVPESGSYVIRYLIDNLKEGLDSQCELECINYEYINYFINNKLSAWELKYSLDNDTNRFTWADPNGKGVIYYMKDEYENEAPYDFKNIVFLISNTYHFTFDYGTEHYDGSVKYGN